MKTQGIAFYAYTNQPDTKFDPCWRVNLQVTDEEATKMKEVGLNVKRNDDGVYEYKFKRNVAKKKGALVVGENPAPRVVDSNKEQFVGIIGNGSLVNVQWSPYNWEFKGKKGVSADLVAVQVLNLIPYGDGTVRVAAGEEFDVVESVEQTSSAGDSDEF